MTVYIVTEVHEVEGSAILAVFGHEPSWVEVESLPSEYEGEELLRCCRRKVEAYEVKP